MAEFKYQFQYDPTDLKAIHDGSGVRRFSPGTAITVWATGIAVCLVLLAAIGSWLVLSLLLGVAFSFLWFYVRRLNQRGMANRESLVRTITISDSGVTEEFADSMFDKSWAAFDEFLVGPQHLSLKHFEKVTTIPIRAIPADELDDCVAFVRARIEAGVPEQVGEFSSWFESGDPLANFRFRWQVEDITSLSTEKMKRYGDDAAISGISGYSSFAVNLLLLVVICLVMFFYTQSTAGGWAGFRFMVFAAAISLPFLVALLWWRYTKSVVDSKEPDFPDHDICVALDHENLMIGYPMAIAKYSLKDVTAFYYSDHFVGFRPVTGMIHVIAKHAFGGDAEAMSFLQLADSLRLDCRAEISDVPVAEPVESGNPFQPPTTFGN